MFFQTRFPTHTILRFSLPHRHLHVVRVVQTFPTSARVLCYAAKFSLFDANLQLAVWPNNLLVRFRLATGAASTPVSLLEGCQSRNLREQFAHSLTWLSYYPTKCLTHSRAVWRKFAGCAQISLGQTVLQQGVAIFKLVSSLCSNFSWFFPNSQPYDAWNSRFLGETR